MELCLHRPARWRVRHNQTLEGIARAFGVTARLLAAENGLFSEPAEGQVLVIPPSSDRYIVQGGESRALLCGSAERFARRNGTKHLYPGQEILL